MKKILYLCAAGNLALCRFHSKHVALRKWLIRSSLQIFTSLQTEIKAMEEELLTGRYGLSV